jgi:hypothetical protein
MTNDFEWKTEDDSFEEEGGADLIGSAPVVRRKWGRWHWGMVGGILLVVLVSFIAYSRLEKRAETLSNQLQDDVLSVHQLVVETAVSRDTDLFQTFFEQPSSRWANNQTELIARDLYFNRAPMGLWLNGSPQMTTTRTITNAITQFTPNFQTVTVQIEQPYLTRSQDGDFAEIVLLNTAVYHQTNTTWQLATPKNAFWGETITTETAILTGHFPARDADTAMKLTTHLNALLVFSCGHHDFHCPKDLKIDLHFATNTESMLMLNRQYELASRYSSQFGRRFSLTLPTPTLVGLPVDEAGYQALYRGYGAQLLAALITNLHPDFYTEYPDQKLLANLLAEMEMVMPDPVGFHPLETAVSPPIPFPDQNILTFCRNNNAQLYLYDRQSELWETVRSNNFIYSLYGLGNNNGALIAASSSTGNQISWWHQGQERILLEDTNDLFISNTSLFPDSEQNNSHIISFAAGQSAKPTWQRFDEANCAEDRCDLVEIDQWTVASENGRFQLVHTRDDYSWVSQISTINVQTGEQITYGLGFSAGWLDESNFAFVQTDDFDENEAPIRTTLVIVDASNNRLTEIAIEDLIELQDIGDNANGIADFVIGGVVKLDDDRLLLPIYEKGPAQFSLAFLFESLPNTNKFYQTHEFREYETAVFLSTSPDNRFFTVALLEQTSVILRFYDSLKNDYLSYPVRSAWRGGFDWTFDSNWLLILEDEGIRLVAPAHDYDYFVGHDFGRCETAVWVNP